MAPGRKRGAKKVKTKVELNLGDLVLAKIKGFPAWPAKISRPEDWEHLPDPKKHFVQFFGTSEIAFVAPADIQSFTSEVKNKLAARCQGKKVRYFAQAVQEICDEFEQLQHKNSTVVRDDERTETLASQVHPSDLVVDEVTEFDGKDVSDIEGLKENLEIKGPSDLAPGLEQCLQRQDEEGFQKVKPSLLDGGNSDVPPSVSSGKNELSRDHTNVARDAVSVSSSCPYEQSFHDSKVEGMCSDISPRKLNNGHKQKVAAGLKKKPKGTMNRNCDSGGSCVERKIASGGSMLISPVDIPSSNLNVSTEKKEIALIKDKINGEMTNDGQEESEGNIGEHNESPPRKKMDAKHGRENLKSRTNKSALAAKVSKYADTGNDIARSQQTRKSESESPNAPDDKINHTMSRRSQSGSKAETRPVRVLAITNELNHSSDEDDLPPTKRHCPALATKSSTARLSEDKLGNSTSRKNDLVLHTRVRSPIGQLPSRRRAVRLCDDEDDESPKTPIHGGFANKDSVIPCAANSQEKLIMRGETSAENLLVSRNSGVVDGGLEGQVKFGGVSNKPLSRASQQGMEQKTGELSVHVCPSSMQLDIEELPSMEAKPVLLSPIESPQSVHGARPSAELQSKSSCKAPGNVSTKKFPARDNSSASASDWSNSIVNQSVGERRKPASTSKSDLQINTHVHMMDTKNDTTTVGERVDVCKDDKVSFPIDSERSGSVVSMKHLIAAAQARKKQAHYSKSSHGNPFLFLLPEADMPRPGANPFLADAASESSKMLQLDVHALHSNSPCSYPINLSSSNQHENEDLVETGRSADHQGAMRPLSGDTEAAVARDAFEGMIETLSRTKESIGRATRLAIDCAKHGIANEVVELLIQKLEKETSSHRRVDLFFLVDSITQCSHGQRGIAGSSYIPIVQAALPRLIGAVAPAGTSAQENRRQCRKVLRLWLERKILPESVLRHCMDVMGLANDDVSGLVSLRRPSRAERAFDDPIREMEGMVVDEYGSNTTFELPGLLSANLFEEEEECDNSTPKRFSNVDDDELPTKLAPAKISYPENHNDPPSDPPHRVLKDVDGELEMEDVSGNPKDEKRLFSDSSFGFASLEPNSERLPSDEGSPPLPPGSPPVTPPLPTSPPPSPSSSQRPPPPPLLSPHLPPPPSNYSQQQVYPQPHIFPPPPVGLAPALPVGHPRSVGLAPPPVGPPNAATNVPSVGPPLLSQPSFPPQPQFIPQHMPLLPSALSRSPQSSYHPPPPLHDVGGTPSGNQCSHVISNTLGPAVDGCVRTDVQPQQASCIPPIVNTAREHVSFNSSRHVEYGQGDAYMNTKPLQHQQQPLPGGAPLHQRPVHPELPPRGPPSHFPYQNSIRQHQHPTYSMQNFSEDPRIYAINDQWRMQVNELNVDYSHSGWAPPQGRSCSGQPCSHGGYFGPPPDRPLMNTVNYQPSGPNNLPAGHFPGHGGPMMPNRPDLFGVNQ